MQGSKVTQTEIDQMSVELKTMTVKEVAKKHNVADNTIYNLQKCGALPYGKSAHSRRPKKLRKHFRTIIKNPNNQVKDPPAGEPQTPQQTTAGEPQTPQQTTAGEPQTPQQEPRTPQQEPRTPQTSSNPPRQTGLPPFPAFNDQWPCTTQVAWFEAYTVLSASKNDG